MKRLLDLLRGFPGHPSHPPFTDATLGAYTVATVLVIMAWLGIAERKTSSASFLCVVIGLVFSLAAVATGFLDYVRIRRGTPLRRVVNFHWLTMATATVLFVVAALMLKDSFDTGTMTASRAIITIVAWLVLTLGGWMGGTLVFVYGMRVVMEPGTPPKDALTPKLRH